MRSRSPLSLATPPTPPPGVCRFEHLPTIEAAIRYWRLARSRAIDADDLDRERTAAALVASYEAARDRVTQESLGHAAG